MTHFGFTPDPSPFIHRLEDMDKLIAAIDRLTHAIAETLSEQEWQTIITKPHVQAALSRMAEETKRQIAAGETEEGGFAVEEDGLEQLHAALQMQRDYEQARGITAEMGHPITIVESMRHHTRQSTVDVPYVGLLKIIAAYEQAALILLMGIDR